MWKLLRSVLTGVLTRDNLYAEDILIFLLVKASLVEALKSIHLQSTDIDLGRDAIDGGVV